MPIGNDMTQTFQTQMDMFDGGTAVCTVSYDSEQVLILMPIAAEMANDLDALLMLRGWVRYKASWRIRVVEYRQMTFEEWLCFYPQGYNDCRELVQARWGVKPKQCVCRENNCNGDGSTGRIVSQPFPNTSVPEHCPCDGHCEYLPDHPDGVMREGECFLVMGEACASCIYRNDSPMDLAYLENQVRDNYGGFSGYRICHKHDEACCRGFWNRHKDDFDLGQIAQRLGVVVEVGPKED